MALIYAARFPAKVRKLALAGAPIDICAGKSRLSELARNTPTSIFRELVEIGNGRVLGHRLLQFWDQTSLDHNAIQEYPAGIRRHRIARISRLRTRFRQWHAWTLDLPGTYYLQAVEQLFKKNQLAAGRFVALGRRIDFSSLGCPLFLLAARDDEIVAPEQLFAVQRLVDRNGRIRKAVAPCTHLGLFMGRATLSDFWPAIARWLARSATGQGEPA